MSSMRPDTTLVADVLRVMRYKAGWEFRIEADALMIMIVAEDSTRTFATRDGRVRVAHRRPIPSPGAVKDWERWVLEQIVAVETHEACEFFRIRGEVPFDPHAQGSRPWPRDGIHRADSPRRTRIENPASEAEILESFGG